MKNILVYVMAAMVVFVAPQCTNPSKQASNDSGMLELSSDTAPQSGFGNTLSLPSPEEALSLFEDSDLIFNADAINKPEHVERYLTTKQLSLNLGVYVVDAAYINMFKQYSIMPAYLESIFNINDKLEITGVYQDFDFKKLFKEMDNPDSLIILSEGMFIAITNYMIETDNEPMLCMISYGSFIELLHLSLTSIKTFKANDPLLQSISDQYMQLDNLYTFASQFKDNTDVQEMLVQLESIKNIWNQMEQTEKETLATKGKNGKSTFGGGVKHKMTAEQFKLLKKTVTDIRTKITS